MSSMNANCLSKYLIRAAKFFIYACLILALMIFILIFIGAAEADISTLFRGGYNSLWEIAIAFAVISAIYPSVGYIKRNATIPGKWEDIRSGVVDQMETRGYRLEKECDQVLYFRKNSLMFRIFRLGEDRITISAIFTGVSIEGSRKDVFRLVAALEYALGQHEESSEQD